MAAVSKFKTQSPPKDSKMSPWRKITKWKKLPKYPTILCLDERTLHKIYQHLSLVDKMCLSLSCKELFCLFGSTIVRHKDLRFPRLLRMRNPILCVNSRDVPRNQLLLRLENHHWAYCAQCLKLHPRKEFPRYSLRRSPLERSCTYYAGIADLCPCISLTIRDRDQLIKILKSPAKPQTQYGFFRYDASNGEQPWLGHCCSYSTRTGYIVQVVLVLDIKAGQLCLAGQHTISFYSSSAHLTAEPTFACPHQDLLSLVPENEAMNELQMYQTLICSNPHQDLLSLIPGKLVGACHGCQTVITIGNLLEESEKANQSVFWVMRNLGSCEWPADHHWLDQCRLTGVQFLLNESYW